MTDKTKKAIESIKALTLKSEMDDKFVRMREGEKPKKGARVKADGKDGEVTGVETITAPGYDDKMKEHQILKVQHPEGTTKYVDSVRSPIAPKGGFEQHYDSGNVRVHTDDIIAPK